MSAERANVESWLFVQRAKRENLVMSADPKTQSAEVRDA
jgi:hypothetical protein